MSQENVDNLRRAYKHFIATGEFSGQFAPDFVWDMSTFHNWPERQSYEGIEGARQFMADWLEAWGYPMRYPTAEGTAAQRT